MKRIMIFVVLILVVGLASLPIMQDNTAQAKSVDTNEFDEVFIESIGQILQEEQYLSCEVVASKELVYDIELNEFGYIYNFDINGESGYAIALGVDFGIEMIELFFNAKSPYPNADYKNIYVSEMLYLEYDEEYGYIFNDVVLSETVVEELKSIACFCGAMEVTTGSETITYNYKNVDEHKTAYSHPACNTIPSGCNNACVAIAAGNIVQFFDRYCENLLPNFTPGRLLGNNYLYSQQGTVMENAIVQLYYDIETNSIEPGASVDQFKSGLTKFCNKQGYNIGYEECVKNNKLDYSLCKEKLKSNKPIALFVSKFSLATETVSGSTDNIVYSNYVSNHCMVAFGYKDVQYTLSSGGQRQIKYLQVATGLSASKGYVNIDYNVTVVNALAVDIY